MEKRIPFSEDTCRSAADLVCATALRGTAPEDLAAAFLQALGRNLAGTKADLTCLESRQKAQVAINSLKALFGEDGRIAKSLERNGDKLLVALTAAAETGTTPLPPSALN